MSKRGLIIVEKGKAYSPRTIEGIFKANNEEKAEEFAEELAKKYEQESNRSLERRTNYTDNIVCWKKDMDMTIAVKNIGCRIDEDIL